MMGYYFEIFGRMNSCALDFHNLSSSHRNALILVPCCRALRCLRFSYFYGILVMYGETRSRSQERWFLVVSALSFTVKFNSLAAFGGMSCQREDLATLGGGDCRHAILASFPGAPCAWWAPGAPQGHPDGVIWAWHWPGRNPVVLILLLLRPKYDFWVL